MLSAAKRPAACPACERIGRHPALRDSLWGTAGENQFIKRETAFVQNYFKKRAHPTPRRSLTFR